MVKAEDIVGAWRLVRWWTTVGDREVPNVFGGERAQGIIMYTASGYMSAHLQGTPLVRHGWFEDAAPPGS